MRPPFLDEMHAIYYSSILWGLNDIGCWRDLKHIFPLKKIFRKYVLKIIRETYFKNFNKKQIQFASLEQMLAFT